MRLACGNLSECSCEDSNSRVKSDKQGPKDGEIEHKNHARNEATAYSCWWQGKCSLMYVEVQGSRTLLRNAGRYSLWPVLMMRLACGNLSECSCEDSNSRVKSDKQGPKDGEIEHKDHARNEATAYSCWWQGKCNLMYVEVQGSRTLLRNAGRYSLWPVLMMRLACGNLSECSCEDSNSRVKSDKQGPKDGEIEHKNHARNETTAYSGWWQGTCNLMHVEVQGSRTLLRNAGRYSLWPVLMMRLACGNLSECSCEDSNSRVKSDKQGPKDGEIEHKDHARNEATAYSCWWQGKCSLMYVEVQGSRTLLRNAGRYSLWPVLMMRLACGNLSECSCEDPTVG